LWWCGDKSLSGGINMLVRNRIALLIALLTSCAPSMLHAQWIKNTGPYGVTVWDVQGNAANLFIVVPNTGIYRSSDNGEHWNPVNFEITSTLLFSFALNGANLFVTKSGAAYRSTDNGNSWDRLQLNRTVGSIAVIGSDVFAGTYGEGVLRSTDNGDSWTPVNSGLTGLTVRSLAASGTDLYVEITGNSGSFRSTDNGANWTALESSLMSGKVYSAANIGTNKIVSTSGGLFYSTDNGKTWIRVETHNDIGGYSVTALAVGGNDLYAGTYGKGVLRSTDNGANWSNTSSGLGNLNVVGLMSIGTNLIAGTSDGVYRSTNNGADWNSINGDLNAQVVRAIAVKDMYVFVGTSGGHIYRSSDNGVNWRAETSGLTGSDEVLDLAISSDNLYAAKLHDGVFRSTDNGATWTKPGQWAITSNMTTIAAYDTWVFGANNFGIYRSSDNGEHWSLSNTGLTSFNIRDIAISGNDVFAATEAGLFYSSNNGEDWTKIGPDVAANDTRSVEVNGRHVMASTQSGLFHSTDNGASWIAVEGGTEFGIVGKFACAGRDCFAATSYRGVLHSSDSGVTWRPINEGLRTYDQNRMIGLNAIAVNGTNIFAGTIGDGLWRRPLSEVLLGVEAESSRRSTAGGISIYPNPVSSLVTVGWNLERRSPITVTIYDALGRIVSRPVVDAMQESGEHEITVDTKELAAGVYLCGVNVGGVKRVARFVVVR
jgi:photosystem II stability/assembly factor-like uncharacterized protein